MSAALSRLARLRESLRQQAEQALRVAQEQVESTRECLESLRVEMAARSASGQVTAATLQLVDLATTATLEKLESDERERCDCAVETQQRTLEHRQVEKLIEREEERERRAESVAEQRASDDWTSSQWSRR
jgi:flagellar biosynthesis chaperone FliJ